MRARRFGPRIRLRIDLHGVSRYGPGEERTLLRWEWIEGIVVGDSSVVVRSASEEVSFPDGAFGLTSEELAGRLRSATSIVSRAEIIAGLAGASGG